ncbi:DNA-binding protein [Candidatus Woesearchaeota archaeon]|nr:MAG: DNA-binding protein [Candidatus Woesearchaeota archaeon]
MDELEQLRKKKLEQLQNQLQQQHMQEQAVYDEIEKIETAVKQRLTKEALARYANIKLAHPELAMQVLGILVQLMERTKEKIDDQQLKRMLELLHKQRKDITVKRK